LGCKITKITLLKLLLFYFKKKKKNPQNGIILLVNKNLSSFFPWVSTSILNFVIVVCKLSGDLFPNREASAMKVSVSVGIMNFVGCWFGAMLVCHGAGGLARQYKFGGRSGMSVIFLGIGKLVLGLVFGNSFARILGQYLIGIFGVLLLFAGIKLAMTCRDMNTKEESFVMLVCAAISLTGSSAALGFREEGRRVVVEEQNDAVLWVYFFKKKIN
jgi:hypothetical protein